MEQYEYEPACIERVVQQLEAIEPYVTKQLCFEFSTFMAGSANLSKCFRGALARI